MKRIIFIALLSVIITACGSYRSLDLNRLTTGMTKQEVINLMGPPNRVLAVNNKEEGYQEILEYRTGRDEVYALEFWDDYLTGYEFLYDDINYIAPYNPPMIWPTYGRPIYVAPAPARPIPPRRPPVQPVRPTEPSRPNTPQPSRPSTPNNRPNTGTGQRPSATPPTNNNSNSRPSSNNNTTTRSSDTSNSSRNDKTSSSDNSTKSTSTRSNK